MNFEMAQIQLESAVTVASITALQSQIVAVLQDDEASELVVDASQVERFDFSLYQLLSSAQKTFAEEGAQFSIVTASDYFARGATVLGFDNLLGQ